MTHIAIGAVVGDALLGKKLGKRAMLLGALAQSLPDIDFIASFWSTAPGYLLAHRGFTHSLLFDLLATIAFALLAEHYHRQHRVGYRKWMLFFAVQISIHLFIDLFNSYGTGLLEPFSHARLSFNALFVADPFFSVWSAVSFVALLLLKSRVHKRIFWQRFALAGSSAYLLYCIYNKLKVDNDVREIMTAQQVQYNEYITTPAPLNNWLWYVVAKTDLGFYVGYHSVFDKIPRIDFQYFSKRDSLLRQVSGKEDLQRLIRFSQGYYTVEQWNDTLVFNDLRFGQMVGWYDPGERFVFHYFLQTSDKDNKLVVQRGRFAKWNWETTQSLIERIRGN
ncbi:MAG TPA: metal-dependent hydrolase [Flavisolibacter sp.]|nr:metal-dependent hydrolase [Flavisolibacter sp.]